MLHVWGLKASVPGVRSQLSIGDDRVLHGCGPVKRELMFPPYGK